MRRKSKSRTKEQNRPGASEAVHGIGANSSVLTRIGRAFVDIGLA
jgi:hypothetical protein